MEASDASFSKPEEDVPEYTEFSFQIIIDGP